MEEELNYSTVVFKNDARPPKETNEDSTVCSSVKSDKSPANIVPNGEAATHSQHFRLLVVCLGILCVLTLVSISVLIYISVEMKEQTANFEAKLGSLMEENQQLIMERSILQKENGNLNWTLEVILKFDTFPVNQYCPQKKCQPCQTGWILFEEKCYLFYNEDPPWKAWKDSQQYCQNSAANLVVIDSVQEQEFVSNHTQYYYDNYHGYWLGLNRTVDKNWVWVDGRNDTLGYWMTNQWQNAQAGSCALMIPGKNVTANWAVADCIMQNKFICESEVLIISN